MFALRIIQESRRHFGGRGVYLDVYGVSTGEGGVPVDDHVDIFGGISEAYSPEETRHKWPTSEH